MPNGKFWTLQETVNYVAFGEMDCDETWLQRMIRLSDNIELKSEGDDIHAGSEKSHETKVKELTSMISEETDKALVQLLSELQDGSLDKTVCKQYLSQHGNPEYEYPPTTAWSDVSLQLLATKVDHNALGGRAVTDSSKERPALDIGEIVWTNLRFDYQQVLKVFPRSKRTGFPGRPSSSKHVIENQFPVWVKEGRLQPTLKGTAEELQTWFVKKHPDSARPALTTIQNNIRADYKAAMPRK